MTQARGTNEEVCQAFADGDDRPYQNGTGSIFHKGRTIYSYGHHFPLAYRNDEGIYIINGDRYSVTTSSHQRDIQSTLRGKDSFTTSFTAMQNAGIDYEGMKVLDHTADDQCYYTWGEDDKLNNPPKNATVRYDKEGNIQSWHLAATAAVKYDDKFFIMGMDENSYFISDLPRKVKTVDQAFDALKPKEVKELDKLGLTYQRQGEWFCFPLLPYTTIARKIYNQMQRDVKLPRPASDRGWPSGNPHIATRGCMASELVFDSKVPKHIKTMVKGDTYLFSGAIRHSEHKTLRVSTAKKPEIWGLARNTALNSWSESGVD